MFGRNAGAEQAAIAGLPPHRLVRVARLLPAVDKVQRHPIFKTSSTFLLATLFSNMCCFPKPISLNMLTCVSPKSD